jgi:transposase-like protein
MSFLLDHRSILIDNVDHAEIDLRLARSTKIDLSITTRLLQPSEHLLRIVLIALGLRRDGKKEVIDFRLVSAESAAQWEQFLGDLIRRGLTGERLEMRCVDGGSGLRAALPTAANIPVQRCGAHQSRNLLNKVRKPGQVMVKAGLHRIMNAPTLPAAWSVARCFAEHWENIYPTAVACLRADLDELTCFRYPTLAARKAVCTTDEISHGELHARTQTRGAPLLGLAPVSSSDRTYAPRSPT